MHIKTLPPALPDDWPSEDAVEAFGAAYRTWFRLNDGATEAEAQAIADRMDGEE